MEFSLFDMSPLCKGLATWELVGRSKAGCTLRKEYSKGIDTAVVHNEISASGIDIVIEGSYGNDIRQRPEAFHRETLFEVGFIAQDELRVRRLGENCLEALEINANWSEMPRTRRRCRILDPPHDRYILCQLLPSQCLSR